MKIRDDFLTAEIGEELFLVPVGAAAETVRGVVRLNETAAFIVNQMKEETTLDAVVDAVLGEYETTREEAEKHVKALLARLREIGATEG